MCLTPRQILQHTFHLGRPGHCLRDFLTEQFAIAASASDARPVSPRLLSSQLRALQLLNDSLLPDSRTLLRSHAWWQTIWALEAD
jgi:hypothetical protein